MRRLAYLLTTLHALTALGLLRAALLSHQHGNTPWALFFGGAAMATATAIVHSSYLRDQAHNALAELERATRPPGPHAAAIADEIAISWHALNSACCLRQWETAGREHDPDHCTRKDQTT